MSRFPSPGETPESAEALAAPLRPVPTSRRLRRGGGDRPAAGQQPLEGPTLFDDLVGTPFELGGRGETLDCLGVVLEACGRLELPAFDVWEAWRKAWKDGELETATIVPEGWSPASRPLRDGDVVLTSARGRTHVGLVWHGRVLTATETCGVVQLPLRVGLRGLVSVWRSEQC